MNRRLWGLVALALSAMLALSACSFDPSGCGNAGRIATGGTAQWFCNKEAVPTPASAQDTGVMNTMAELPGWALQKMRDAGLGEFFSNAEEALK